MEWNTTTAASYICFQQFGTLFFSFTPVHVGPFWHIVYSYKPEEKLCLVFFEHISNKFYFYYIVVYTSHPSNSMTAWSRRVTNVTRGNLRTLFICYAKQRAAVNYLFIGIYICSWSGFQLICKSWMSIYVNNVQYVFQWQKVLHKTKNVALNLNRLHGNSITTAVLFKQKQKNTRTQKHGTIHTFYL